MQKPDQPLVSRASEPIDQRRKVVAGRAHECDFESDGSGASQPFARRHPATEHDQYSS